MFFQDVFPDQDINQIASPLIDLAIEEDCALHDITSRATIPPSKRGTAELISKQDGILAGLEIVPMILAKFPDPVSWHLFFEDGQKVSKGDVIFKIEGSLLTILSAERTVINFLQHLGGIATLSNRMVAELGEGSIQILDTRKTTPAYRFLEKYAVFCGGARNHRANLCDMFLIKENHIRSAGSLEKAIQACKELRRKENPELLIEIEVTNLEEFQRAHDEGADIILLDHFSPEMVKEASGKNKRNIPLELSGNVRLETLKQIRDYPVQYVSSGALTHSAPAMDLSILIEADS